MTKRERRTAGWREWAALPELGIRRLRVKLDTGARTSTLHANVLEQVPAGSSGNDATESGTLVRFRVPGIAGGGRVLEAELVDEREVRDSGGNSSVRPVIRSALWLDGTTWPIEITLWNRDEMTYPMLLGRTALRRRFLVDPGRSHLLQEPLPRRTSRRHITHDGPGLQHGGPGEVDA